MRSGRDQLDDHQSRGVIHRGAARPQDGDAPVVVPVVQDALEDIDVATARDRREEVALDELATIGHPLLGEVLLRELEHARPFQQDAGDLRMMPQDLGHQGSRPASDIDDVRAPRRTSEAANSRATGRVRASMRAAALASTSGFAA